MFLSTSKLSRPSPRKSQKFRKLHAVVEGKDLTAGGNSKPILTHPVTPEAGKGQLLDGTFLDQKLSCGDLDDLVVGVEHGGQAARLIQNPLNEKGESIVWIR